MNIAKRPSYGVLKNREQQLFEKGYIPCPNHPTKMIDPTKYKECFACWAKKNPEKANEIKARSSLF